ncbi:T5orf172 domain protein [Enhygromyxa salina]|uniref:T5orf172 domain protein n=1 Tax=Enhygromyxa salina TaxID=215803 RepID=A0A2S9XK48_9BACT|nr:DUF4041 domain-containing protein [Enhygromyxa salina]PRP93256.1 T5orf172 domain protein [Enhygromyxa salina]
MLGYILAAVMALALVGTILFLGQSKRRLAQVHQERGDLEQRLATAEAQLTRFQSIRDIEATLAAIRAQIVQEQQQAQATIASYHAQFDQARAQSEANLAQARAEEAQLRGQTDALRAELAHLNEQALFEAHGLYESNYDFGTADEYKRRLDDIRDLQKSMTKEGLAAVCRTTWTVEGSAAKGRKMIKDKIKLMLRAFNGECDAAIARVKYNNIESLEKRVTRAHAAINKLGAVNQCEITSAYFKYKIDELRLTHSYKEKRQAEKEEQRLIREQMREEERAQKEIEAAQKAAEAEESKLTKAIAKAQQQAESAAGKRHDQLLAKIDDLQQKLAETTSKRERAVSRAQITRSGHVYVISNIGSFGEHVYKIGMTRRLEPLDRVKELGDASVPFRFDVHAMIYCEDAPKFESELQRRFAAYQVNLVNNRKEFFKVSLDDIEAAVKELRGHVSFVRTAAAEEFRKSQALRTRRAQQRQPAQPAQPAQQPAQQQFAHA